MFRNLQEYTIMKNKIYIILAFAITLSACNLADPLKDDLENVSTNVNQQITYTLTDDDFSTIATRALFLDPTDTVNADFLRSYKYFTDAVPAANYAPLLLDEIFPNLGSGSQGKITYKYNGSVPEELTTYTNAPEHNISTDGYALVAKDVAGAGYFSPKYKPDKYIPSVLTVMLDTAASGDMYRINYKYSDVTPEVDYSSFEINSEWQSDFKEDLSAFQLINVKGVQEWTWSSADNGAAAINGYDNGYFENEDWMISPKINLSNVSNTYMSLVHGVEYYGEGSLFILVSTDYDGTSPEKASWSEIPFPKYEGSNKNNFIETDPIDLTAFDGKKVNIAFKYVSTKTVAPYWGIGQIKIGSYGYKTIGGYPAAYSDFYSYDGSEWSKVSNVHCMNSNDFETLQLSNNYFTKSTMASDYLPQYAGILKPISNDGDAITFVFNYDDNGELLTLADQVTKTDGAWVSSYDFVRNVTEPYASTTDGWVFDPTVVFTMAADDYQLIVDYVNSNPELAAQNSSTYDNTEYYYGASAYYSDFDVRAGNFNSGFATWQDAIVEAIGKGLLPSKFPDAQMQYKGIDMHYIVHFETYGAAATYYYVHFQCTKSAPDPEFTLIEGPIAK